MKKIMLSLVICVFCVSIFADEVSTDTAQLNDCANQLNGVWHPVPSQPNTANYMQFGGTIGDAYANVPIDGGSMGCFVSFSRCDVKPDGTGVLAWLDGTLGAADSHLQLETTNGKLLVKGLTCTTLGGGPSYSGGNFYMLHDSN